MNTPVPHTTSTTPRGPHGCNLHAAYRTLWGIHGYNPDQRSATVVEAYIVASTCPSEQVFSKMGLRDGKQ